MVFVDGDKMPYSLSELEAMFGGHFLLKEIAVPEGYRLVSDEIRLEIASGANKKVLLCNNTYESGVWAAPKLLVTATDTIYVTQNYAQGGTLREVQYYNPEDNSTTGTLFGVIFKYIGEENGNRTDPDNWVPVYGNSMDGYSIVPGTDKIQTAITAARAAVDYGAVTFTLSASGAMQVTLENMPGDIMTYNRMLGDNAQNEAQYTVGYCWTSASSLNDATTANTYRVITGEDEDPYGLLETGYSGFDRAFGSTIHVPNLANCLFAQKFNDVGALINGATFALYKVSEEGGGIRYVADGDAEARIDLAADGNGDNKGTATVDGVAGTYEIDAATGVITVAIGVDAYTITPVGVETTRPASDAGNPSGEDGTATFSSLLDGHYYLREIAAPDGYALNTTEVMVLVTDEAVYANAGTADDGVTVARGPGYIASTLDQFASKARSTTPCLGCMSRCSYPKSMTALRT